MQFMMDTIKVEVKVVSQSLIKPSSPTPPHKKNVKFSFMDHLSPPYHMNLVLFYQLQQEQEQEQERRRGVLKTSLSQVLTQFYPYAGRINMGNSSIECTDTGVFYTEAEVAVNCCLSRVISESKDTVDRRLLNEFVPVVDHFEKGVLQTIPLLIQANFFKCDDGSGSGAGAGSGVALGIMASHKVMDAVALFTFICSWATITKDSHAMAVAPPDFTIPSSLFPIPTHPVLSHSLPKGDDDDDISVSKRFVFEGSSIDALKAKLSTSSLVPTRVQAVSALIWKCAIKAYYRANNKNVASSSVWGQSVNTRMRWEVPLPDNTPGNHAHCQSYVQINLNENEHELLCAADLVYRLKDGMREFRDNFMKKLEDSLPGARCGIIANAMDEILKLLDRDDTIVYLASSWCGFKLYDYSDFGWGTAEWIGSPPPPPPPPPLKIPNFTHLVDTKEGNGIEATVILKQKHMASFEQDQDLLLYARPAAAAATDTVVTVTRSNPLSIP